MSERVDLIEIEKTLDTRTPEHCSGATLKCADEDHRRMPVYHFIFHSYGSWLPDHPDGYYDRKNTGRQSRNEKLAITYQQLQTGKAIEFSPTEQLMLLESCKAITEFRGWGLHGVAVVANHMHIVVSWSGDTDVSRVKQIFKVQLTRTLNTHQRLNDGKRFSRGSGDRKIRDWDHLIELIKRYFPGHGDHVWIEEKVRLKV